MTAAVFLDFGGTLDADGVPWAARLFESYRHQGGVESAEAFEAAVRRSDRWIERLPGVRGFGFRHLVRTQVSMLAELLADGPDRDRDAWTTEFVAAAETVARRNRPVLETIRARFRLGVVSNFLGCLQPCLEELNLADCFDLVLDSGIVGIRKPDVRLFLRGSDAFGVLPASCWMVGDNPFADIEPAGRIGFRTCWIAPESRPAPPGIVSTRRIASLLSLPEVVS
jgi:HAD superfamily hydrolase (TIGR01509 family)